MKYEDEAMNGFAKCIFQCLRKWGVPLALNANVEADLYSLHPGEKIDFLKQEYYARKIVLAMRIVLLGFLVGILLRAVNSYEAKIPDGIVKRQTFEMGNTRLELIAESTGGSEKYALDMAPRNLTEEEVREWMEEFVRDAGNYILGDNQDLQHIYSDLCLEEAYDGFPFDIQWSSDNPEAISRSGKVYETFSEVPVVLTFSVIYGGMRYSRDIQVVVSPPIMTETERGREELLDYLHETEQQHRAEDEWKLPDTWNGKELEWRYKVEDYSLLIWFMTPVIAGSVFFLADKDLHSRVEEKHKELERDYADIVHKIVLYTGAGMTVRGAVQKVGSEYERCSDGKDKRCGYEEIKYICRELQSGVSEGTAYERMGKRTGVKDYIKLSSILIQDLKRGNGKLQERLTEEADRAIECRLAQARKLGEESGTKLLLPMVIMLGVAMLLILYPAFSGI